LRVPGIDHAALKRWTGIATRAGGDLAVKAAGLAVRANHALRLRPRRDTALLPASNISGRALSMRGSFN